MRDQALRNRATLEPVVSMGSGRIEAIDAVPAAAEAVLVEPPHFPFRNPGRVEWVPFDQYANSLGAQIVANWLEGESVPCIVEANASFPGAAILWVPKFLHHRARWLTKLPIPSDSELVVLATGELLSDDTP